ncbi:hypothetical protein CXB40_25820 [Pseudomonas syringae pv. avii]|nr:hypothetical protein CXB40_25820 [Pseudomonas syringae pv. avii]
MGVWGSFTTPRSRGQRGRCGMTRAAPLVFKPHGINNFRSSTPGGVYPVRPPLFKDYPNESDQKESRHHQLHRHCRQNHHRR